MWEGAKSSSNECWSGPRHDTHVDFFLMPMGCTIPRVETKFQPPPTAPAPCSSHSQMP